MIPDPFEDEQEQEIPQAQETANRQVSEAIATPLMSSTDSAIKTPPITGTDSSKAVTTNKPNHEDKFSRRGGGRNFDSRDSGRTVTEGEE